MPEEPNQPQEVPNAAASAAGGSIDGGGKPTAVRYEMLAWMCSLSLITYADRVCIKEVAGAMRTDLGISIEAFAWVFSSFSLAYALFEVPTGWLGDRFGPRAILTRIVLWWSLFTAATGLVGRFRWETGLSIPLPAGLAEFLKLETSRADDASIAWLPIVFGSLLLLMIIRFLFGMGEAGAYPNAARALRGWFPYRQRGLAQGLLWSFARWGGALGVLLIHAVMTVVDWRGAFFVFGAVGVAWVVAFRYFFRDSPESHPRVNASEIAVIREGAVEAVAPPPISWRTIFRSPSFWLLCAMYFFSNAGWCFFITLDKEYYRNVCGLSNDSAMMKIASSSPLFFGGLACLVGGLGTDWQVKILGKRWGRTLQGFFAYLLGAVFFFVALFTTDAYVAVPLLCLAHFFKDLAMAVSWSTCIDIGHRYSGTISGFMNMIGNFGQVFAPPLVAALSREYGWNAALIFSGTTFFLASLCWLYIEPRRVVVYAKEA